MDGAELHPPRRRAGDRRRTGDAADPGSGIGGLYHGGTAAQRRADRRGGAGCLPRQSVRPTGHQGGRRRKKGCSRTTRRAGCFHSTRPTAARRRWTGSPTATAIKSSVFTRALVPALTRPGIRPAGPRGRGARGGDAARPHRPARAAPGLLRRHQRRPGVFGRPAARRRGAGRSRWSGAAWRNGGARRAGGGRGGLELREGQPRRRPGAPFIAQYPASPRRAEAVRRLAELERAPQSGIQTAAVVPPVAPAVPPGPIPARAW